MSVRFTPSIDRGSPTGTWRRPRRVGIALLTLLVCATAGYADDPKNDKLDLTVKDVLGQELKVPAADQSTIVVFVRTDQPQSQKTMEQVRALAKDAKSLQVLAIVSGDQAQLNATQLAKDPKWLWPVISDPDYALSGKVNVCAWPTTMVVNKQGTVVAHIGGYPSSFAVDLAADLEFAAGKIDQATLTQRTTAHEVITDSTDQKAGRHLQVARRLLEQGMPEASKTELTKALEFAPHDPALQLSAARLLVQLGDVKAAGELVAKVDAQAVPAAQLNLVRGQIELRQEKWDEALRLFTEATRLNPDPAEAYYGMGLVYQHKQDWPHATQAFQKAFESTPQGRAIATPAK